jgi:tRNA pseudouridine38-40 synthase
MYRYSIAHGGMRGAEDRDAHDREPPAPPPLFDRHFVYYTYHRLDVDRMSTAAQRLVGEHDFTSFAQISHGRQSAVRTIFQCRAESTAPARCHIDVVGSGFLYNMVRIIAGTLVEAGRGRCAADDIAAMIAARDRRAAGPTLPPHGLCLHWVDY